MVFFLNVFVLFVVVFILKSIFLEKVVIIRVFLIRIEILGNGDNWKICVGKLILFLCIDLFMLIYFIVLYLFLSKEV